MVDWSAVGVRELLKHGVERAAVTLGGGWLDRRRNRPGVLVLAYHNVVPDGSIPLGDRSLHLPRSVFASQLDILRETHEVISVRSIMSRLREPDAEESPAAVITFDDAYSGALTLGVGELTERGLPATIFVPPGCLGRQAFWWDVIAESDSGLPPEYRDDVIHRLAGSTSRALEEYTDGMAGNLQSIALTATVQELSRAAKNPGITLGAHGWEHLNLRRLSSVQVEVELSRPLEWLINRYPMAAVSWLAYPYGLGSKYIAGKASRLGYDGSFLNQGGICTFDDHVQRSHFLPRVNISRGVSEAGFRLRTAGVGI